MAEKVIKSKLPEYKIWKAIKARVKTDPHYLSKNIKVSEKWINNFDNFYKDMGKRPDGFSIDRIDNNGDYSPENCRWASMETQTNNRGSFNKIFSYNGEVKTLKEWSKSLNIKYTTLYNRIYRTGLSFEEAINEKCFNKVVTYNNENRYLKDVCDELKLCYKTIYNRLYKHGWTLERSITEPLKKRTKI